MNRREALARLAALGVGAVSLREEETLPWSDVTPPADARTGVRFTDLSRVHGPLVPNDAFFVLHHGAIPQLDSSRWRLRLSAEIELALDAIRELPKTEATVCFECAGNGGAGNHGLVGTAVWGGTPLAPLLRELKFPPTAREVVFYGADAAVERLRGNTYPSRFARSLPLADALAGDVMLAYEMNGKPLPVEHGAPLRLIVPGWYGIAQVKWLTRIEVVDHRFMGWYMAKDYVTVQGRTIGKRVEHRASSVGRQKLKSVVTRVTRRRDGRAPWRYAVHGFAWNDGAEIASVEVSIDDGSFRPAELDRPSSRHAWIPFRFPWETPEAGRHRIVSRARDVNGVQPTAEAASRYKATPWENNGQVVREIEIPAM